MTKLGAARACWCGEPLTLSRDATPGKAAALIYGDAATAAFAERESRIREQGAPP